MHKTSISENIRLIRESRGYSQDYIANRLNITQQAYSNMEKKPEGMSLSRLKDLAKVLDVSLLTLINEDTVLIQQNFNQAGGNAASKMEFYLAEGAIKIYEELIKELREENNKLRNQKS